MAERIGKKAEWALAKVIERKRLQLGMTRLQLGKMINEKDQQIAKYETGSFVPLDVLERIGEAFNMPIQKKEIRRISFLRKLEKEKQIEQLELIDLYEALFVDE